MAEITHRTVKTNGITLHVAEAGPADGKPVILCHGFPESWYSWRHQVGALADAGYHVLAPDQRGYGDSDLPDQVTDYGIGPLTDDLLGLLDDIGEEKAVFVGHDWGALIVWDMARIHPDRMEAVVGVSVPYFSPPMKPTELFETLSGGNFFYILYFQEVGPAEQELGADPRATMTKVLYAISGEALGDEPRTLQSSLPREGTGFLTAMQDMPLQRPSWLTEADIDEYTRQFTRSGFFGPVSYYRNLDANWEITKTLPPPPMPSFFIGGDRDPVLGGSTAGIDLMKDTLPDFRGHVLIGGAGHWTQQEAPEEFNQGLLEFLSSLA